MWLGLLAGLFVRLAQRPNKHNAGVAASDDMLDEMVAAGDVAIAAYGH